jgi:hypothetical protein
MLAQKCLARSPFKRGSVLAVALTSLALAGGCSNGGTAAGADAGVDAGDGGASNGGSGGSVVRPPIPPATFTGCSELRPTYAGAGCGSVCGTVRCQCAPFPSSYISCHPELGCLTGMDCSVACERDLGDPAASDTGRLRGK